MEQAQQAVSAIWNMTVRAREWVANVSDLLHPGSDPRRVDDGRAGVGVTELQKFLSESHSLPVSVAEADELTRIIHVALEWQRKVDETLTTLQAPVRPRAGRVQLTMLQGMLDEAQLIPVRLDKKIELTERVHSKYGIYKCDFYQEALAFPISALLFVLCSCRSYYFSERGWRLFS